MIEAIANLKGNYLAPHLKGTVVFYPWQDGTLVQIEVFNLPSSKLPINNFPPVNPFAFHIHDGSSCAFPTFDSAGKHFDLENKPHPFHSGDLPSLLANDGYAFMSVYTNRFKPSDVIGKTVIIHLNPDDYRTQPTGNAGERIGCGIIKRS